MHQELINLILCGGSGARLWPLSRTTVPKQFAPLLPQGSLFQANLRRNATLCADHVLAVSRDQWPLAEDQLESQGIRGVRALLEPMGRNTAPAIALVAMALDPEQLVLVSPSDHVIAQEGAYARAIAQAIELAGQGYLVTFGMQPHYPETGFGYIETSGNDDPRVRSFREKPDYETARSYVASGTYLWNAGMFLFKAGVFVEELARWAHEVYTACRVVIDAWDGSWPLAPDLETMSAIPAISIDYAVMEKSSRVAVVRADMGWSDLGSFDALYEHLRAMGHDDSRGNALSGSCNIGLHGSQGNLVIGSDRTVALLNVDNLMVVDTPDALLVASRGSGQDVREVVDLLRKKNSGLIDNGSLITYAWGSLRHFQNSGDGRIFHVEISPGHTWNWAGPASPQSSWQILKGEGILSVGELTREVEAGAVGTSLEGGRWTNSGAGALVISCYTR